MLRKQHKPSKSRSRRQSLGRQRRSTAPSLKGMPTSDSTAPELRHDTLYHLDHDSTQLLPTTAPSATPHYRRTPYYHQNQPSISSRHRDMVRTASDNTRPYSASSSDSSSTSGLVSYSKVSLLNISSNI